MTALSNDELPAGAPLRVRPAPRREPPFDDELPPRRLHVVTRYDQPLPFEVSGVQAELTERPGANAALPDPAAWGRRLLIGITETAGGRRPLQQLSALLSHSVAYGLRSDFERHAQLGRRHWTSAAVVRSVRASEPADGVAELSATVHVAGRVRAVALRLEERHGRWHCTRLHLG
jgi:hypothetical protein